MPGKREEQREGTRRRLVETARGLFGRQGYAATSTTQVLEEAGLARGALYHHFRDKADLLRAVYEQIEGELVEEVVRAAYRDPDMPLTERLDRAVRRYLKLAATPEIQRIVLTDVPAVLGPHAWRELDEQYGLGLMKQVLGQGIAEGLFRELPLQATAQMLLAALNEGAAFVARAEDPGAAAEEVAAAFAGFVASLRA